MNNLFGYTDQNEQKKDIETWFDALLRFALIRKEKHGLPGLVITKEEAVGSLIREEMLSKEESEAVEALRNGYNSIYERSNPGESRIKTLLSRFLQENIESKLDFFMFLTAYVVWCNRKYERLYAYLQDNLEEKVPTAGLVYALYQLIYPIELRDGFVIADTERRVFRLLFRIPSSGERAGLATPLKLYSFIPAMLEGVYEIPSSMRSIISIIRVNQQCSVMPYHKDIERRLTYMLRERQQGRFYNISGGLLNGQKGIIHSALSANGYGSMYLSVDELSSDYKEQRGLLEELTALCRLQKIAPVLIMENEKEEHISLYRRICEYFIETLPFFFLITEKENLPFKIVTGESVQIRVCPLNLQEKKECFEHFLADKKIQMDVSAKLLAGKYQLGTEQIERVLEQAEVSARIKQQNGISLSDIEQAVASQLTSKLSTLAARIEPSYTWQDIKLYENAKAVLIQACNRIKYKYQVGQTWGFDRLQPYGKGISVLMYGPPGTGKTMAAQIMAQELGLALYRINLSTIVSKYVGETEKNLSKIFDEAKNSNVILFFDEADALFSKRTEIQNSNDKFANTETAFILQKMEEYSGMCIMATNRFQNIDEAFIRRITYSVHFDSPDEKIRLELWKSMLPKEAETAGIIDFEFLAKQFELTGSNIKSAMFDAAYRAAGEGKPLGAQHIVKAIKSEYQKMGKILDASVFGEYSKYVLFD